MYTSNQTMPKLSAFSVVWEVFRRYRWHIVALAVLGSLGAILEGIGINAVVPLISFFNGGSGPTDFISSVVKSLFDFIHIPFSFRYLLGFILLLFFARAVAGVTFGYIRAWIEADFLADASDESLRLTLLASWPFLLKQKMGTLQNTLVRDVQRTTGMLSSLSQVIQSFTGLLMYLLVAFNISPLTTFLTMLGGTLLLIIVRPLLARTRRIGEEMAVTEKSLTQFLIEHIIGMKAIKAAGMEKRALTSGRGIIGHLRHLSIRLGLIRSLNSSLFQPFSLVFVILLFVLTYRMPGFSIISFAAVLYLIQKIFTYLESAQTSFHGLSELIPYAHNVVTFRRQLREHQEDSGKGKKDFVFKDKLQFNDVSLAYREEPALEHISFVVSRGETVGIVGPSGAGKTSIADLLLQLFKPSQGSISLDGVSIDDVRLSDWRAHVGYVAQDVFLFNGSVSENIRFYRPELSDDAIKTAAKQANIYDHIMSLPEGFETNVGDRGVTLSGGQRQRIALARVLVGKPELLILDEATSALDSESERLIHESIESLHGSVTVIIIAHRFTTVEDADKIIVLERGQIVEEGSPKELLADQSSYFYKMQQ
jgi:ABC-type multidrug transport system fused ATPase/permease subunit